MKRREFIKKSCGTCALMGLQLIVGGTLLESCMSGKNLVKTKAIGGIVRLPATDFSESSLKIIRLNNFDFDIVLQKLNDGHYRAMELKCTHAGHPLTKSGSGYYCTLHGSVFSEDGRVLKGPASEPMLHFKTAVENNQILIYLI